MTLLEPPPVPDLDARTLVRMRTDLLREISRPAARRTRRGTRRLVPIAAGAIAATVGTIVALTTVGGSDPAQAAFATRPTPITAQQQAYVENVCRHFYDGDPSINRPFGTGQIVVAGAREDTLYFLLFADDSQASDGRISSCMPEHPYAAGPEAMVGGTSDDAGAPASVTARPTGAGTTFIGGSGHGSTATQSPVTFLYGRSGPDVASIRLSFGDSAIATAEVTTGGWWTAWYPGSVDGLPAAMVVRATDGSTHRVPLPAVG